MATSRTGTTRWINLRNKALTHAQNTGQRDCPLCRTPLDWTRSRTPDSPEPDHIIPHANGGADTLDNIRIICRQCNQKLGGKLGKQKQQTKQTRKKRNLYTGSLRTSQRW